jgi:hypothetical protein
MPCHTVSAVTVLMALRRFVRGMQALLHQSCGHSTSKQRAVTVDSSGLLLLGGTGPQNIPQNVIYIHSVLQCKALHVAALCCKSARAFAKLSLSFR